MRSRTIIASLLLVTSAVAPGAAQSRYPPGFTPDPPAGARRFKEAVAKCVAIARARGDRGAAYSRFDAYVPDDGGDGDFRVRMFGTDVERFQFGKCMAENGQTLDGGAPPASATPPAPPPSPLAPPLEIDSVTMGFFMSMPLVGQSSYVLGVLGALFWTGLECHEDIRVREIVNALVAGYNDGRFKAEDELQMVLPVVLAGRRCAQRAPRIPA